MKKKMVVIFIALVLILSACSGTSTTATAVTSNISDQNQTADEIQPPAENVVAEEVEPSGSTDEILNTSYENAVSIPMQLFWGTFELLGSKQAITKEQAAVLLPLWINYQTLTSSMQPAGMQGGPGGQPGGQGGQPGGDANQQPPSDQAAGTPYPLSTDTAATEEQSAEQSETQSQIDDLINEIMTALTTNQLQAIADMHITQEIAMTIMEEQGITIGTMSGGEGTPQADQASGGPGGQQTQGTPPTDMGGAMQGTPSGDAPQGGNQMGRGRGGDMISSDAINALIMLLANSTEDPDVIATAQAGASNGSTSASMTIDASLDISDTLAGLYEQDGQSLTGDLTADEISSIAMTLQNGSSLEGAINSDNIAESISLTLDASSRWIVTADSYLTNLEDTAGISGTSISNIVGNGFTVYYDTSACPVLGGQTYTLDGGGYLTPAN